MKSLVMFIGQAKAAFKRALLFLCCVVLSVVSSFAAGGSPGASAITKVTTEIGTYIDPVQKLLYAIAGVVALTGAISVYIKMNNEEQDVKKSIMLIVGACIFLVAAAEALPMFFGY